LNNTPSPTPLEFGAPCVNRFVIILHFKITIY
jgi:hypothetical protein